MVLGVGILMKVVTLSGGIKLMVAFLQSVMNPATASTFMAGAAQQENAEERFPQNKMFIELFGVSFVALFILAVLAFTGIYTIIL